MPSIKYDDYNNNNKNINDDDGEDEDDDDQTYHYKPNVEPITNKNILLSNTCGHVVATAETKLREKLNAMNVNVGTLPPELSDNVMMDNFNNRRRRGRLRTSIILLTPTTTTTTTSRTIAALELPMSKNIACSDAIESDIIKGINMANGNADVCYGDNGDDDDDDDDEDEDDDNDGDVDGEMKTISMINKRATNKKTLFAVNIACPTHAVFLLLMKFIMLLLPLLLKFVVKYVNKINTIIIIIMNELLMIVLKAACASNYASNSSTRTSTTSSSTTSLNSITTTIPTTSIAIASARQQKQQQHDDNNNNNNNNNNNKNTKCLKMSHSSLYKTIKSNNNNINNNTTISKNIHNNNNNHRSSNGQRWDNCTGLFYATIIFASILIPCSQNVVSAARPKSAQQHNQQQEREKHQNQQQPQQTAPAYEMATIAAGGGGAHGSLNDNTEFLSSQSQEKLFDGEDDEQNLNLSLNEDITSDIYETHRNDTNLTIVQKTPLFPKDLFTREQLENGAVVFHIIGVIYMFVALAIVCDEFFVPSLDVIIEKLDITDDVAGATFMAAGGSAPELFTSVIGVFVSFDDVGIGTIVGSAVFNILFVIGMCALFSKTVLTLTWWPLFRDCSFYSISLMVLIYFFRDSMIFWWEALILFSIYVAYVGFMKWNVQVEHCVKKVITKNKVTRVRSTDQLMPAGNAANSSETSMATQPGGSVTSRAASESRSGPGGSSSGACGTTGNSSSAAGSTHTGAKFRHGLLQLMIHTIDPLHDDDVPGKVDEKATQLHAIASLKVLLDATKPQRGGATTSAANHVKINLKETTLADRPNGNIDTTLESANEIEDEPEPLSMAWPDTARKRLTYVLVAPLLIPMWLTLPDTRTPRGKRFFPVTFIGSILWIAAFSYLMVWWANVAGDTARIPPEVMGLTFLAAGTSIPDLITSVIVARKGFGDMAVSSSVGSNIFDVTVGLPVPWLLYGIIYGAPVEVNSQGMVCSITILFMMLIFVVISIACFRWKMNKGLGFTMFLLYFVFVAVSLMFEYKVITCPF